MTYYDIATRARGRIDLRTGRLERRGWHIKRTAEPDAQSAPRKRGTTSLKANSACSPKSRADLNQSTSGPLLLVYVGPPSERLSLTHVSADPTYACWPRAVARS
jgi:hypothetical protein